MLINIHGQHMDVACLCLKPNLIPINQSNQQFWDVSLSKEQL